MSLESAMDTAEDFIIFYRNGDHIEYSFLLSLCEIYEDHYLRSVSDPIPYPEFVNALDTLRCHKDSVQ